jgi:hypothetical protein
MDVLIERRCGLDVHQKTVVVCLLVGAPGLRPTKGVRTFRTMTRKLKALRDRLEASGVPISAGRPHDGRAGGMVGARLGREPKQTAHSHS